MHKFNFASLLQMVHSGIPVILDTSFALYPRYIRKIISCISNPNSFSDSAKVMLVMEFKKSSTFCGHLISVNLVELFF